MRFTAAVRRIAHHEFRQMRRTGTLLVLAVAIGALLVAAAVTGITRRQLDDRQRDRFQAMVEVQWREQPDRHPHRVSHYGYLVFRPRAPLGFFDSGLESFTGTSLFLEAHRQNLPAFSDAAQDTGARRFGDLTMAQVLQLLVPLLVFALIGPSVARERESGTLSLLLSQGVSLPALLWGKLSGGLLAVGAVVVPGLVIATLWMTGFADLPSSDDLVTRALLLGGASILYVVVCAGIAVVVGAQHDTARGALVTLVGVWLVLWVLVPRALPGLATTWFPLPSRAAFEADVEQTVRTLGDSHNPDDPTFTGLRARTLAEHGVTRVEDLPFNYNGVVMTESERMTSTAYREHLDRVLAVHERHGQLVGLTGFLSPYVAMRTLSMALAGVDLPHAFAFDEQAEAYRYALIQRLNTLHTENVAYARDRYEGTGENGAPSRQRIASDHWHETPLFTFTPPGAGWALARQPLAPAALAAWLGLILAATPLVARLVPRS